MNTETVERLVKQAKSDPQFFHDLVWNTEQVLGSLGYLSREEKAAILAIRPEDLVAGLATGRIGGGGAAMGGCGGTCTATCGGSCTATCVGTCPATGLMPGGLEQVINPAESGLSAKQLAEQIRQITGTPSFSQFRR